MDMLCCQQRTDVRLRELVEVSVSCCVWTWNLAV